MKVYPSGSRPTKIAPDSYFTGTVFMDAVIDAPEPARLRGLNVTFMPGARTHWHTHPVGQTLIVTAGLGRMQAAGGPVRTLNPGDVVFFEPGEKHWHGAAPGNSMTHIALQEAQGSASVQWLEPVDDADYLSDPTP
ncbi:MAG: cupin domain-containing protein [Pseudomonadota bacterium]